MPVEPPIHLPIPWVIALNVVGWPIIQIGVSVIFQNVPTRLFHPDGWLFRRRWWEGDGDVYGRWLAIRSWKHLLPDGAPWLRGFAKKRLNSSDAGYLTTFAVETCRGEAAHWMMLASTPIFFLWNPLWADVVMIVYALGANLPCILTQRYNRVRMRRVARRQVATAAGT